MSVFITSRVFSRVFLPVVQPRLLTRQINLTSLIYTNTRAMSTPASNTVPHDTLHQAVSHDHREMYAYYDEYVKAKGDPAQQTRWSNQLIWEVARHAVSEELVVYPLMERALGAEGKRLADHDREEHQTVKQYLYDLESLTTDDPRHSQLLEAVMKHLRPHNDSEEQTDLPLLEREIGEAESRAAAQRFERTKKFVPTHPHPSAPNQPPFETVVGLMTAPMDKLRDLFETFPTEEERKEAMKGQN